MSRTAIRYVKWKIFFDGVEVPWVDFSVQTGVDSPGEATISLPPDPMLMHQRARTKVHIFMFDEFEEGVTADTMASDKKAYKLYWEGESAGIADNETPTSRQFVVVARGIMSGLARSQAYMMGLGAIAASPLLTGSSLLMNEGVQSRTLLALSSLASSFDVNNSDYMSDSYSERALRLIAFLASHNAWLRMHVVRTGLIGKIAGIEDRALTHLIPRVLASPYFKQVAENTAQQDITALDILTRFNSALFYHYSSGTLPKFMGEIPSHLAAVYPLGDDSDRYALKKLFERNDYFILPEMYYAIPPACNLIFPEMNTSFSIQRQFDTEPTRAVLVDGQLGTNVAVVAPDELFRYDKKPGAEMKPEEVWGVNWSDVAGDAAKSPYVSPSGTNLFAAITDIELERGISALMSVPPFQVFSAVANHYDLRHDTEKAAAALVADTASLGELFIRLGEDAAPPATEDTSAEESTPEDEGQSYIYMLKALANYNLTLTRFTRQLSISMLGHRWLVPGFPTVILRRGGSYAALVRAHRFSVDANGQETSSVDLDYARPLPVSYAAAVSAPRDLDEASSAVAKAVSVAVTAAQSLRGEIDALYKEALRLSAVWKKSNDDFLRRQQSEPTAALTAAAAGLAHTDGAKLLQGFGAYVAKAAATGKAVNLWIELKEYSSAARVYDVLQPKRVVGKANSLILAAIDRTVASIKRAPDGDLAGVATFGDVRISNAVHDLMDAVVALGSAVTQGGVAQQEFAFPPLFANNSLIEKTKAETLYEKLLGAKKIYTSSGASSLASVASDKNTDSNAAIARQNSLAYSNYLSFLESLGKIFPIGGSGNTEWEERSRSGEHVESVRDWEERNILRRTGMQDLGSFAKVHGLSIEVRVSGAPTAAKFYVLSPEFTFRSDSNGLVWDNTLFSAIVDDAAASGGSDFEIKRLRASVADKFLTTKVRQEYWIAYSSKHWGSRAHDLS